MQDATDNSCRQFGNVYRFNTYRFTPSVSGTYTFTRTSGSNWNIFNLYSNNFTSGNPCTNFIGSSGRYNGSVSTVNSYTATLNAGQYYTMAVGTFADGTPALPANYTITATGPGGLYSYTPDPGAGFNYTFVIVDNATGLIKAIDASADLSNASNYPFGGNYTVYGLSYSNAINAATLNSYAGTSFAAFRDAILFNPNTFCGSISQNNALVTITAVLNADPRNTQKTSDTQQNNAFIAVYPNPVRSALTLAYYSSSMETIGVRILNSVGSLVYRSDLGAQKGINRYSIPAGALSKGVYVVQLVSNTGNFTTRFVKE